MTDGNASQFVIYQSDDGKIKLDVRFVDETVWLTQQQLAELFQTSRTNVVEHIQHIYEEGELDTAATCREFRQVRTEGTREVARNMILYNLDMTLSVGYRVKSAVATRFRIWATQRQAMRRVPMTMNDWIAKLHGFLTINDRDILTHAGKISHEVAKTFAETEYENFNKDQITKADHLESDFDQAMKRLPKPKPAKQKKKYD